MERGVRRRLDALIGLVSLLLGIVLTVIFFDERISGFVLVGRFSRACSLVAWRCGTQKGELSQF